MPLPDAWITSEIKSGSRHPPIEHAHDFAGATGHRDQFAPGAYFDHAKSVLPQHVRSHVVFGANDQNRENARVGVNWLQRDGTVSHDSVSLH